MIEFLYRLSDALPSWEPDAEWSLARVSEETQTSVSYVLQCFSDVLERDFDITESMTLKDAARVVEVLRDRCRDEIVQRERFAEQKRHVAVEAYDRAMDRLRVTLYRKQWYSAFRGLCYFTGQYEENLPRELVVNLCSEIVRVGIKSDANIQELGRWLEHGVSVSMTAQSREGVEDALDLVDAYAAHFLDEVSGNGMRLLGNILAILEEPSARFELWQQYKDLVDGLYPAS
ncbi:MAG: hypothetical protein AB8C84_03090 [Oligoflexales bacterium]